MDTLKEVITALSDVQFALDLNTPIRVMLYGVAQKPVVRVEKIVEAGVPKIVIYLEEFSPASKDEQIRAISG